VPNRTASEVDRLAGASVATSALHALSLVDPPQDESGAEQIAWGVPGADSTPHSHDRFPGVQKWGMGMPLHIRANRACEAMQRLCLLLQGMAVRWNRASEFHLECAWGIPVAGAEARQLALQKRRPPPTQGFRPFRAVEGTVSKSQLQRNLQTLLIPEPGRPLTMSVYPGSPGSSHPFLSPVGSSEKDHGRVKPSWPDPVLNGHLVGGFGPYAETQRGTPPGQSSGEVFQPGLVSSTGQGGNGFARGTDAMGRGGLLEGALGQAAPSVNGAAGVFRHGAYSAFTPVGPGRNGFRQAGFQQNGFPQNGLMQSGYGQAGFDPAWPGAENLGYSHVGYPNPLAVEKGSPPLPQRPKSAEPYPGFRVSGDIGLGLRNGDRLWNVHPGSDGQSSDSAWGKPHGLPLSQFGEIVPIGGESDEFDSGTDGEGAVNTAVGKRVGIFGKRRTVQRKSLEITRPTKAAESQVAVRGGMRGWGAFARQQNGFASAAVGKGFGGFGGAQGSEARAPAHLLQPGNSSKRMGNGTGLGFRKEEQTSPSGRGDTSGRHFENGAHSHQQQAEPAPVHNNGTPKAHCADSVPYSQHIAGGIHESSQQAARLDNEQAEYNKDRKRGKRVLSLNGEMGMDIQEGFGGFRNSGHLSSPAGQNPESRNGAWQQRKRGYRPDFRAGGTEGQSSPLEVRPSQTPGQELLRDSEQVKPKAPPAKMVEVRFELLLYRLAPQEYVIDICHRSGPTMYFFELCASLTREMLGAH
jgi:hypothetical protein